MINNNNDDDDDDDDDDFQKPLGLFKPIVTTPFFYPRETNFHLLA